ncbi:hypothetical protein OSTOST_01224 [Ostertagia ostertagi]
MYKGMMSSPLNYHQSSSPLNSESFIQSLDALVAAKPRAPSIAMVQLCHRLCMTTTFGRAVKTDAR